MPIGGTGDCFWNDIFRNAQQYFQENWQKPCSSKTSISEFRLLKTLGSGSFGEVVLARRIKEERHFAIKILRKDIILKKKQVERVLAEKRIMQAVRFPFIVELSDFFMDERSVYLVMPYLPGGDMYERLRQAGRLTEEAVRFYVAQVVLGLEFLHSVGVAYRDLKPENLLLDKVGYLRLADLGLAKVLGAGELAYTLCGSPEYLAPEVVACSGYSTTADWWSLGVLVYELAAGYPPFYSLSTGQLLALIAAGSYTTPAYFSPLLTELIAGLLTSPAGQRLGSRGPAQVRAHHWFSPVDWEALLRKACPPPFLPLSSVGHLGPTTPAYQPPLQSHKPSSSDLFDTYFRNF